MYKTIDRFVCFLWNDKKFYKKCRKKDKKIIFYNRNISNNFNGHGDHIN